MATVVDHVKSVVSGKADKEVIDNLVTEKANKVDTEMCLRWVDLLHKMVNKVVLLITTKLKVDCDVGIETQNNRTDKKVQLLQQGLIISKWIESFDSQNINDFYFMTEKEKQPQRIQQVQMQFKRAIKDIENQALSPHLANVNRAIKKTKDGLDLRQDDSKFAQTVNNSLKLRLNGRSSDNFDTFDAEQIVQDSNERYGNNSLTTRNYDTKGKSFPPRLSPRTSNHSVDPAARRANLLTNMPKADGYGPSGLGAFGHKKNSVPVLHMSQEGSNRMTSKYNNFARDSGPIEVDINAISGEPYVSTTKKRKTQNKRKS